MVEIWITYTRAALLAQVPGEAITHSPLGRAPTGSSGCIFPLGKSDALQAVLDRFSPPAALWIQVRRGGSVEPRGKAIPRSLSLCIAGREETCTLQDPKGLFEPAVTQAPCAGKGYMFRYSYCFSPEKRGEEVCP